MTAQWKRGMGQFKLGKAGKKKREAKAFVSKTMPLCEFIWELGGEPQQRTKSKE